VVHLYNNGRLYAGGRIIRVDELGQRFVWLFVSSIKKSTRRVIRPDELSCVVRLERRTTEDSSFSRINASCSLKTGNLAFIFK